MMHRESGPDSSYYEQPYIPTLEEREEWQLLPLLAVEAHHLLVNNVDNLSEVDKQALMIIANGENIPDETTDFLELVNTLTNEYSHEDDDYHAHHHHST